MTVVIALAGLALLACFAYLAIVLVMLRRRRVDIWWRDWLRHGRERRALAPARGPVHVMFCFVDHFEPGWRKPDEATEHRRMLDWTERYPAACRGHVDADGRFPQHSFFFPSEEYRPEHIDALVALCARGYGEIEVHLHHDDDTEAGLRANLGEFLARLRAHGAIPVDPASGQPRWAFIHGNWALDNSRDDGRWCGVNNELVVLREMGCYADFTLPSAPSDTQTSTVNSIYYATDDPARPKSHDRGERMRVGGQAVGDLLIMQGPLCLRWQRRMGVPVPTIENADVRATMPPVPGRVDAWVRSAAWVQGRPEWLFVKVHTHGTQERDAEFMLGGGLDALFSDLEGRYNDGVRHVLHYVTAREAYNIAKAAEAGKSGNPGDYRDFCIARPAYAPLRQAAA